MKLNFIVCSILVIMAWGVLGIFYKLGSKNLDIRNVLFWASLFGAFFYTLTASILAFNGYATSFKPQISLLALSSFCGISGFIFWIYGVNKFSVKEFVAITAIYPVVTTILAVLVLSEQITIPKVIGIILAVLSVIFVSI